MDLGSLCHIEHETAPPFVDAPQIRAVPKIKYDISGRKPDQTRQKKNLEFWGVESTEAQPRGTDGHHEAPMRLDSNTPENGHFSAGGSVHRSFSSESVPRGDREDPESNGGILPPTYLSFQLGYLGTFAVTHGMTA